MFFGAGNLIFPLVIGKSSGTETLSAISGLAISAVVFPFLGLMAVMLYQGDMHKFLERLGKWPAFFILLILQLAQGPLCISRLFTLMHASLKAFIPWAPLSLSTFLIAAFVFFLTYKPQRIVTLLGALLTPFLLISLTLLVFVGHFDVGDLPFATEGATFHFLKGLKGGYLTMDLIGALFFAGLVLPSLSRNVEGKASEEAKKEIKKRMIKASFFAASLLTLAYIGLCSLAAHHSLIFSSDVAPEDYLQAIAEHVFGPFGSYIAGAAVFLACLTTAISLAAVFAAYLQKDIFKEKISSGRSLALTVGSAAAIGNLGFSGVIQLIGPLLEIVYPALALLCILNIVHSFYTVKSVKAPVFFLLGFTVGRICFGV